MFADNTKLTASGDCIQKVQNVLNWKMTWKVMENG